jgi:hypothetical protein
MKWGPRSMWPMTSLKVHAPHKDDTISMFGSRYNGESSEHCSGGLSTDLIENAALVLVSFIIFLNR